MPQSDAQLVKRSWAGDQSAFGELVQRHRGAVQRLAERLTGDAEQAQDLTQETFLRAYVRLGEVREPERFAGWLLTIVRSICSNWLKLQAMRRHLENGAPLLLEQAVPFVPEASLPTEADWAASDLASHAVGGPTPAQEFERREAAREVISLVEALPEPYRATAQRYYLAGQSQPEIARELGVATGTVKARLHHARHTMEAMRVSRDWYGGFDLPQEEGPLMTPEELAQATLRHYDLGALEAVGSTFQPSTSTAAIGIQTAKGRYRLWRCSHFMSPELVQLQHAMLQHLDARGVPVKRLVPARDGTTVQQVGNQLVALFEWFSGETPDLTNRRDLTAVAELHAKWTLAMADFDPPIEGWRELASGWRPRKTWAWVLPTQELPLVPSRMGFFSGARDVEDAPAHHQRMLAQLQDTEQRLRRFAQRAEECGLADLPRGMNHGVFLFGHLDWELTVTNGDDFHYESRIGDLGRLVYALHDRGLPPLELRERVTLALDTYREHVALSPDEVRALPLLAWGMQLYYDTFHVLLYLHELDSPDRGVFLVADRTSEWTRARDEVERSFEELSDALATG